MTSKSLSLPSSSLSSSLSSSYSRPVVEISSTSTISSPSPSFKIDQTTSSHESTLSIIKQYFAMPDQDFLDLCHYLELDNKNVIKYNDNCLKKLKKIEGFIGFSYSYEIQTDQMVLEFLFSVPEFSDHIYEVLEVFEHSSLHKYIRFFWNVQNDVECQK